MTIQEAIKKAIEYIIEVLCLFGFHNLGKKENRSAFIDNGGWAFGWVARYGRTCQWCGKTIYSRPFLRNDRNRMIKEASIKKNTN